jgi:hypothetical protein
MCCAVNDVDSLARVLARAGEAPEAVLEATYGWYWAVDTLEQAGARSTWRTRWGQRLAYRRVKNDVRDATELADVKPSRHGSRFSSGACR